MTYRRAIIATISILILGALESLPAQTYPQLALGGGFEVILILTNAETERSWEADLHPLKGADEAWDTLMSVQEGNGPISIFTIGVSDIPVTLAPGATKKITLRGDATARAGYLEIDRLHEGPNH